MKTTTISQILLATSTVSAATLPRRDNTVVRRTPTTVTENYVPLKRVHRGARTVMRRGAHPGPMKLAANQFYPVAEVTFGDEVIPVLVDTGSSDTWVVRGNFSCVTQESKPVKDVSLPVYASKSAAADRITRRRSATFPTPSTRSHRAVTSTTPNSRSTMATARSLRARWRSRT